MYLFNLFEFRILTDESQWTFYRFFFVAKFTTVLNISDVFYARPLWLVTYDRHGNFVLGASPTLCPTPFLCVVAGNRYKSGGCIVYLYKKNNTEENRYLMAIVCVWGIVNLKMIWFSGVRVLLGKEGNCHCSSSVAVVFLHRTSPETTSIYHRCLSCASRWIGLYGWMMKRRKGNQPRVRKKNDITIWFYDKRHTIFFDHFRLKIKYLKK